MSAECLVLSPNHALTYVQRERKTRKEGTYIVYDKLGQYLILSQKLPHIVLYINSIIATDYAARVSVPALYNSIGKSGDRVNGYSKHRWKIIWAALDEARDLFERERGQFDHAIILGPRACYTIASAWAAGVCPASS